MFHIFLLLHTNELHFKQVSSIVSRIFIFPSKHRFSTRVFLENLQTPTNQIHKCQSSINFSGIAKNVISKCSHLWNTNNGETVTKLSLKDFFLRLSSTSPETIRRFWRVHVLSSQDVLEILLGFESYCGKDEIEHLWGIFNWASEQSREFEHFPHSCKIMGSLLVRVGLFREVEYLLSKRECEGILLDCQEIFDNLMKGYVDEFEFDQAISLYHRMRGMSLVPSRSSYHALFKYLFELNETELVYHVYADMINVGMSEEDKEVHENVVRLLCIDGKVQEARYLIKNAMNVGIGPSSLVINSIVHGYCEKKDYNDLISLFSEMRVSPDTIIGNKVIFSLCRNFGVEQANIFLQKLEELSFFPVEITFGILIGFSCREGKLKSAFNYVSKMMSRSLKPHIYSYNALLSSLFMKGMWIHSRDMLLEMNDMGVIPDFNTFRVLIAGFCKARKFDEVKAIIHQMEDQNLVKLSSSEDYLTKAFTLIGLDPLAVKIKRDNDKGFFKTEFFDDLGNGLYLDTDIDVFEKKIAKVFEDAMMIDFNSILENFHSQDTSSTMAMVDEMEKWGQEMSLPAASSLLNRLCVVPCRINTITNLLGVIFKLVTDFDDITVNMLVQSYSKKGLTFKAQALFDGMVQRGRLVENCTYSALLCGLAKKGYLKRFHHCHELARKSNWSPEVKDGKTLFGYLCKNKWLNEALQLLETIVFFQPYNSFDIIDSFLEELCYGGFSSTALNFLEEFQNHTTILDDVAYNRILGGFYQEKKFLEVMLFLDTMLSKNLTPPLEVSIQLITKLCRSNNFEKAIALKTIILNKQPSAVLPINSALINGFSKQGRVEEGASIFKGILLKGLIPDIEVFAELIQGYCEAKKLTIVKELYGAMVRRNLRISVSSYSNMVCLISREGKFSLALSLKELMLQVTNFPELVLYNILIFHISSSQNSFLLDAVIDSLQKKGLQFNDVTYNMIIRGFLLCKNVVRSHNFLMSMIKQDLRPSNRSLREVISCLCHNEELEKAMNLSREMESRGWIHGSVIQIQLVKALLKNGKLRGALHFLDQMELKELIPENINYDVLIKQFYQHGQLDRAVHLLNIMLMKGNLPESISYDYIIQGLFQSRNFDRALDFHSEVLYRDFKLSIKTWDVLVCGLSEEGRVAEAEKLLKTMIEYGETPSREMFCSVINNYRFVNNSSKASEILKVMQEKGYEPDFDTHWSVISKLTDSSKKDDGNKSRGFLSGLVSGFGFAPKSPNSKVE